MKKIRIVSTIFTTLTLLAAYTSASSGAPPSGASTRAGPGACSYARPINIDIDSLPKPIKPELRDNLDQRATSDFPAEKLKEPDALEELKNPLAAEEDDRIETTVDPQDNKNKKYVRNYRPLKIKYSDFREKKIAGCGLELRTYNGELIGPTLRVKPGQTLRFTVENNLPPRNEMHDLTNLHTHGLEVDPGNYTGKRFPVESDNVLINYGPGEQQQYEITIPADHPPGTFWYHPHTHGSTAAQVSSGMTGALIVEDDKGNLDRLESDRSILPDSLKNVTEKIMFFQTMLYNDEGNEEKGSEIANLDLFPGPAKNWKGSNRRITINGQLVPKITMRPGEVQRWRMISSTFEELVRLQLAEHDLHEIALDGHYLPRVDTWTPGKPVELQAGYRSDVLVKAASTEGTYLLVSPADAKGKDTSPAARSKGPENLYEGGSVLAAVVVKKEKGQPDLNMALPTDDEMRKIAYGWTDDKENASLESLWKKDEDDRKVTDDPNPRDSKKHHIQSISFDDDGVRYAINGKAYPAGDPRKLVLDRIDKWVLTSKKGGGPHLFHIHTNPFQVLRIGPNSKPGTPDELVWKDTFLVRDDEKEVTVYTKYERFTGRFVMHCHLLDHEDNGMMEVEEVVKE